MHALYMAWLLLLVTRPNNGLRRNTNEGRRKVAEGKSKMSALNNIRNKLVDRMFAVVKRKTPYQEILSTAA